MMKLFVLVLIIILIVQMLFVANNLRIDVHVWGVLHVLIVQSLVMKTAYLVKKVLRLVN